MTKTTNKFYWYCLTTNYGPGRHGQDIKYFFTRGEISKEGESELLADARNEFGEWDQPAIARLTKVDTVPAQEVQRMIRDANETIKYANLKLEALASLQQ